MSWLCALWTSKRPPYLCHRWNCRPCTARTTSAKTCHNQPHFALLRSGADGFGIQGVQLYLPPAASRAPALGAGIWGRAWWTADSLIRVWSYCASPQTNCCGAHSSPLLAKSAPGTSGVPDASILVVSGSGSEQRRRQETAPVFARAHHQHTPLAHTPLAHTITAHTINTHTLSPHCRSNQTLTVSTLTASPHNAIAQHSTAPAQHSTTHHIVLFSTPRNIPNTPDSTPQHTTHHSTPHHHTQHWQHTHTHNLMRVLPCAQVCGTIQPKML